MRVEDALGWASKCVKLASQDDADALPVQTATAGDGDDDNTDVSWAQGMIAVCALLFVVGHLVALVRAYARPQQAPGAPIGAAEDAEEDDEDVIRDSRASVWSVAEDVIPDSRAPAPAGGGAAPLRSASVWSTSEI